SELSDSLTYDITAWALPYAYNLVAFASTQKILPEGSKIQKGSSDAKSMMESAPYAWLLEWNEVEDAGFLGALLEKGIKVRYAKTAFALEGKRFEKGTLVITKADNINKSGWSTQIQKLANEGNQKIYPVSTGFADNGKDLGSYLMELVKSPSIALVYDDAVDKHSYGFIWHFLETELGLSFSAIPLSQVKSGKLDKYNTLILPDGYLSVEEGDLDNVGRWVEAGNKLIVVGNAHKIFEGKEGWGLTHHDNGHDADADEDDSELTEYGNTERTSVSMSTPGAIIKTHLDTSHPLANGLGTDYFSLKTNDFHQPYLEKGWNVGYLGEDIEKKGFIGSELLKKLPNTVVFGVKDKNQGAVVYLFDDPLFRGFWYQGKLLFSNALFF
ncbi:MAG: hypothetical protein KDC24_14965, partial [Saprospiraceae bacterium]|nr:hypothetical protein [Saprospiraceae bacterium]